MNNGSSQEPFASISFIFLISFFHIIDFERRMSSCCGRGQTSKIEWGKKSEIMNLEALILTSICLSGQKWWIELWCIYNSVELGTSVNRISMEFIYCEK